MPEWPLVGRADELRLLRELLVGGERSGIVLAGPSGVGKTRLALECLDLAERADLATARVTATRSAAQLPFGALAPILPEDDRGPGAVDDRADLLRRSAAALAERADGRRLVLFVDDAHLLDDASATLIQQLTVTGVATVLATVRTGEPTPDPIVALWKDETAERIEVGGLSPDAIEELLSAAVGGQVDPATVAQFTERCRGNALFLRELVTGALQDGSLYDDGGVWRLRHRISPSSRLVEIVENRLGGLDEEERNLLELVAFGEPLGPAELTLLANPAVAEALERRELLTSHMDGRRLEVRLAHPLYGDVLRARTPAMREQTIARSLAAAVELTGARRPDDVLRVAAWRLVGGGARPDLMLAGATVARWRYDFALAERLARAAADAGAGFDAALLAAQLASLQGRPGEAERELAHLAARATDDSQRGRVAVTRFDNSAVWRGADEMQILDAAEGTITDPVWRDELTARRVGVLLNTRGPRAAAEAAAPLLDRATGPALVFACVAGSRSLARLGRVDAALAIAARGEALQGTVATPLTWYPWWHTVNRCVALQYAGRFHEAEELATQYHQEALAESSPEAQAVFAVLPGMAVAERGRVRSASRGAREALALNHQLGRPLLAHLDHIYGAMAAALDGRPDDAAEALAALEDLGLPQLLFDEVELIHARAWTAAAAGDLPRAREHFARAAALGDDIGDRVGEAAALHGLARLGRAREVSDRLAIVARQIDGDLAPARAVHADALARSDPAGLEKVSRDFEAMGADLLAAEAAADAAVAWRQAGEPREAAAAERRAALLIDRCEGAVTPALQPTETRVRLTPAERETAVLAASGRSNREIAEHLILSPRTVENRLQRVYEKLGITRRTELAAALELDA